MMGKRASQATAIACAEHLPAFFFYKKGTPARSIIMNTAALAAYREAELHYLQLSQHTLEEFLLAVSNRDAAAKLAQRTADQLARDDGSPEQVRAAAVEARAGIKLAELYSRGKDYWYVDQCEAALREREAVMEAREAALRKREAAMKARGAALDERRAADGERRLNSDRKWQEGMRELRAFGVKTRAEHDAREKKVVNREARSEERVLVIERNEKRIREFGIRVHEFDRNAYHRRRALGVREADCRGREFYGKLCAFDYDLPLSRKLLTFIYIADSVRGSTLMFGEYEYQIMCRSQFCNDISSRDDGVAFDGIPLLFQSVFGEVQAKRLCCVTGKPLISVTGINVFDEFLGSAEVAALCGGHVMRSATAAK